MEAMITSAGITIPEKFEKYVAFPLDNVKCNWIKLNELDTAFEHKWCVDLLLDDTTAAQMKAMGFNVKDITDKNGFVTKNVLKASKKEKNKDGSLNKQPAFVGPDGVTPVVGKVGNGTVLNLRLTGKAWKIKGEWSLSCYIDAAQVVDLVAAPTGFEPVATPGAGLNL